METRHSQITPATRSGKVFTYEHGGVRWQLTFVGHRAFARWHGNQVWREVLEWRAYRAGVWVQESGGWVQSITPQCLHFYNEVIYHVTSLIRYERGELFLHIMQRPDRKVLTYSRCAGISSAGVTKPARGESWERVPCRDPSNKVWAATMLVAFWRYRLAFGRGHPLLDWYNDLNRITLGDILEASLALSGREGVWYGFRPLVENATVAIEAMWNSVEFSNIWCEHVFLAHVKTVYSKWSEGMERQRRVEARIAFTLTAPDRLYGVQVVRKTVIEFL